MTEYLKRVYNKQSEKVEYYHWNTDCPDIPRRGKDTMLIFQDKPLNYQPCQKCIQLDEKKKAQRVQASKNHQ